MINGLLGHGNAIVQKLTAPDGPRGRRRVIGLQATQPSHTTIVRRNGVVRYYLGRQELDPRDIIHIAGDLLDDPEIGVSPLTLARETVASGRAAQIFEGRWYKTDGAPSSVLHLKGNPTKPQRKEFVEAWEGRHQPGTRRTGLLWNEARYETISVSLKDAEWAATIADLDDPRGAAHRYAARVRRPGERPRPRRDEHAASVSCSCSRS